MPRLLYRAVLDHAPETVFAFVADAENNPRWHDHVRETRWIDDGPNRLGRRGRQLGHLFWRDWSFVAEVVEWDPPRLVTFQVIEGYRVRSSVRVEPQGDGTLLSLTVTTPRILGERVDRLVSAGMQRWTGKRERGDIARLKRALGEDAPGA